MKTNNKKLEEIPSITFDLAEVMHRWYKCECDGNRIYYANKAGKFFQKKLNSLFQEIEEKVEEAYKEGIVTFENNHRGKPMEKDMAEGFAKGAWTGFKAAYLDKALKTIKERYLDGNESKGGVNNG